MSMLRRHVVLCIVLVCWTPAAAAQGLDRGPLPEPLGYVTDHAKILDPDWRARIRSVCQDLERKTGVEMVVVTVPELGRFPSASDYASALFQRWGVGTAQRDHGVLLLASIKERAAAITVGRGLLGVITPSTVDSVGRQYLEPAFRHSGYGEGLYRATVSLASSMQDLHVGGETRRHIKGLGLWITLVTTVGALAFLWWISRPDQRHPYQTIRRGLYWGAGHGGFSNLGGFGGGTRGGGYR
jgi:uncharacterized protein